MGTRVRLRAMERFEREEKNREIAAALRVSERSVERWRRAWRERGEAELLSAGSPGRPELSAAQVGRLESQLERGPLVQGWRPPGNGRPTRWPYDRGTQPSACTRRIE
ncbi:helix-turn-helix domain-containing protein [Streptomyces sp. BK022]|uniref:helix-turn-helix domain-containing protein n=1 Tax=Streptomyces sp. BK022 TaxID=2512123 RepID=UPI0024154857|nr:helix-turn-helix domain-containing protein [Streptomyces sp. BK022]